MVNNFSRIAAVACGCKRWQHAALRMYVALLSIALCCNATAAQGAKTPRIPIEYYDLSEISLVSTKPSRTGGSAVFRDPTGHEHRIKIHRLVAAYALKLVSVQARGVTLGRLLECPDDVWCLVPWYEWKVNASPVQLPIPTWVSKEERDPPGRDEWPVTVEGAVRMILSGLPDDDKLSIKNTKYDELALFHHGWGTGIRNDYGLWRGNNKLILSACGKPCHPDSASMNIIQAVWAELQK